MPKKLLLHIGCHKTGTTAIQRACMLNRDALRDKGWSFALGPRNVANWGNIFGFPMTPEGVQFRITPNGYERLGEGLDGLEGNVILSAEDLFFLEEEEIGQLAKWLAPRFDEIEICAYLRRQDELAVSQKAQGAKTVQSALLFGTTPGALPELTPGVRRYLDFAGKLEAWRSAFGGPVLTVHEYNRARLSGGDIVTDFFARLGLEPDNDLQDVNRSLGANQTQLLLSLRAAGLNQVAVARARNAGWIGEDSHGGLRPSRAEAQAFLAEFAGSNRRLPDVLGHDFAFHDDMSKYPETPQDTGYAEYERDNLLALVARLSGIASVERALPLYNIGKSIAEIRPRMALTLMELASELDPARQDVRRDILRLTEIVQDMDRQP
ncbi:hypothetical protein ACRARG_21360 [Pseudooceanicola sp. C21-150M6]|uniref:hypothetical protein n=1 Tax=Pseudooceanicola sp. C21-150M6 TaxID=3434355 RepID=UPI003D7FA725